MAERVLVVPTNRPDRFQDWLRAWGDRGGWDTVIVVEDALERSAPLRDVAAADPRVRHYSWKEIDEVLGDAAWIISRGDSAIRCFGLWSAWSRGAKWILTLDDDCYPLGTQGLAPTLFQEHEAATAGHRRWLSTLPGQRTRGLPYRNQGTLADVVANVGLWTGSGDPDAVQELTGYRHPCPMPRGNWVVPCGQYVPVCGMNLFLHRDAVPLFYFPPMGRGQPYRRFDDIWAGVIAKKCLDHLGWSLSVGEPFVDHRRAGNPFRNLVAEAPGIAANETFWASVDGALLAARDPAKVVRQVGAHLATDPDAYLARLGRALQTWAGLFGPAAVAGPDEAGYNGRGVTDHAPQLR
jgi:reversibly glycosylated polypeptide / UDP-arabinopyranose mutase